jgi:SAM-dependent methyltransferase
MRDGSISYSRIADRYERSRGGDVRAAQLAAAVGPWVPDGLVCDVGAGTGVVTDRLRRPGADLLACDLSPEMLTQAAARLPGRVHLADATALALRDGSVDGLTYVWVLHHVGDLTAALTEARRVLRPGGTAVSVSGMSLPAEDDMSPIFERLNDELRPERRDQAMAVAPVGAGVGLTVVHEGWATTTASVSPDGLADAIADGMFSFVWDLPAATWTAVVEPAMAELRALPDPAEPRQRVFRHPLVVLTR